MSENATIKVQADISVSSRDLDLVTMIANDMRSKDICLETGVNLRTVEQRIFAIRKKYRVKTLPGLVSLFYKHGLLN